MTTESFIKEFSRILAITPRTPSHSWNCEHCESSDQVFYSKNLTYCFDCVNCEDSVYVYDSFMAVKNVDCDYAVESQLCYESVDPYSCFNCDYVSSCIQVTDSAYSVDCRSSHDLFGCYLLRNKAYCIFNRQCTKEEYFEKVKLYKTWSAKRIFAEVETLQLQHPRTQTIEANNTNTHYGNFMFNDKDCYYCFDAAKNKSCMYMYDNHRSELSVDATYSGLITDCYEIVDCVSLNNCSYVVYSKNCNDSMYLYDCFDVKNSLGCVGLSHKQYCILNRQYTKEEYERIATRLQQQFQNEQTGWATLVI